MPYRPRAKLSILRTNAMKYIKFSILSLISLIFFLSASQPIVYADTSDQNFSSGDFLMNSNSLPAGQNGSVPQNSGSVLPSGQTGSVPSSGGQTIVNPLKVASLYDLLTVILKALVTIGSLVLTAAFIWIGFNFVTAQGDPAKLGKARKAFLWTVLGGLLLLGAAGLGTVIQATVNGVTS